MRLVQLAALRGHHHPRLWVEVEEALSRIALGREGEAEAQVQHRTVGFARVAITTSFSTFKWLYLTKPRVSDAPMCGSATKS